MAITRLDRIVFSKLKASGSLPPRPSVIELGEANWFGDIPTEILSEDIETFVKDEGVREELHLRMAGVLCEGLPDRVFNLAKLFYRIFLDYRKIAAIDMNGMAESHKRDLNFPVDLGGQFDILINTGTAEHVFNVFQFFKTSHELTAPGGLMIHYMPFRGFLEHGFYSFNPTFYWDLAAANGYSVALLAYAELEPPRVVELASRESIGDLAQDGKLGDEAVLYAVLKKAAAESAFRIPVQGIYSGAPVEGIYAAG